MLSVLRLPTFRRLALAYGLNELAQQVAGVVLMLVVYERTHSAIGAGGFLLCTQFAPAVVSPPLVGRLRSLDLGRALPGLYGVEGALYGLLALAVAERIPLGPLLVLVLLDGILAITARTLARVLSVGATAPRGLLREGNAFNNVIFSVCYMIGPGLGGLLLLGGTTLALGCDGGIFAVMGLVLAAAPRDAARTAAEAEMDVEAGGGEGPAPPSDEHAGLREALVEVWRDGRMRRIFAIQISTLAFFTIPTPVEVVLAVHTLHSGSRGYSLLLSLWGAGTVIGSAAYSAGRRLSAGILLSASAASIAAGFGVLAAAPTLLAALAGAVLAGGGNGVFAVAMRTLLQESIDARHLVAATAVSESVWQAVPAFGIIAGGALASLTGARATFAASAMASILLAGLCLRLLRPLEASPRLAAEPEGARITP